MAGATDALIVRVSPKRTLLRTALLSFVLVSVPLFGALYLLGVPRGTWLQVLVTQLASFAVVGVAVLRYRLTFVGVSRDHVVVRGFLTGLTRIPQTRLRDVVLVQTYRSNAPDTSPQLLLTNDSGAKALRMRGLFWSEHSMRAVAEALDRPLEAHPGPITAREYVESYPAGAHWYENRRTLSLVAVPLLFLVSIVVVLGLMQLAGVPFFTFG